MGGIQVGRICSLTWIDRISPLSQSVLFVVAAVFVLLHFLSQ